jgi:hypothetical protein
VKTCTVAHRAEPDLLQTLADAIQSELAGDGADAGARPAHLVAGVVHDEIVELIAHPLDCHPTDALMGFTAPENWWCLGVVAHGRAHPATDRRAHPATDRPVPPRAVQVIHLVSRDGEAMSLLREAGAATTTAHRRCLSRHDGGQIHDCCRRALGLATAPPPDDSLELWASIWLDRVLAQALAGHLDHAGWADVAALHAAFDRLAVDERAAARPFVVGHLGAAGRILADAHPWDRLRAQALLGHEPTLGLSPDHVAWMDVGMFARAARAAFLPIEVVLADLDAILPGDAYRRLVATLSGWDLLGA